MICLFRGIGDSFFVFLWDPYFCRYSSYVDGTTFSTGRLTRVFENGLSLVGLRTTLVSGIRESNIKILRGDPNSVFRRFVRDTPPLFLHFDGLYRSTVFARGTTSYVDQLYAFTGPKGSYFFVGLSENIDLDQVVPTCDHSQDAITNFLKVGGGCAMREVFLYTRTNRAGLWRGFASLGSWILCLVCRVVNLSNGTIEPMFLRGVSNLHHFRLGVPKGPPGPPGPPEPPINKHVFLPFDFFVYFYVSLGYFVVQFAS